MDANRFDAISRLFAERRLSRRQAVIKGSGALAATGLAAAGIARAVNAQDATPTAGADQTAPTDSGAGNEPDYMFVQSFKSGTLAAKEGTDGRYVLSLESGVGQTIYFSDRPDRIVGAVPTQGLLASLGFDDPSDPPNAALVFEDTPGNIDVAVVELFSPVYDQPTEGLTYEVSVLKNWRRELDMEFSEYPTDLAKIAPSFGTAHLFIDGLADCPDSDMTCYVYDTSKPNGIGKSVGTIPNADHDGYCVQRPALYCGPCQQPPAGGGWGDECNRRFSDCNGNCRATPLCTGYWCS
jgi:hypothetical protein